MTSTSLKPPGNAKPIERVERFFVRHRDRLVYVHMVMFVAFIVLIFGPLLLPEPPSDASTFTHLTKFANYVLWGIWFPTVFLSVIFTGRSWCGLFCPMGAAAEWANKAGPKLAIPAWLRWEWLPVLSFIIVTVLGQTVGVRDHPEAAALVFGGTMGAAIVLGFLFGRRRRTWCRHLCPIGLLLGVFSRLGAVEFRPKQPVPGGDQYTEKGVCPTMIDIARKTESRHCIECFRCVNPDAKGGLAVRLRHPGTEVERIRDYHPNAVEVWFLFMATGVALGAFLWQILPLYQDLRQSIGEWAVDRGFLGVLQPGPWWLMSAYPERREVLLWLDFGLIVTFMTVCMVFATVVLAATTAAAAELAGRAGGTGSFRQRATELGYQYAPVAMVSLVIGIGGALFEPLAAIGLSAGQVGAVKAVFFGIGLLWSLYLGIRILGNQGLGPSRRLLPMVPGALGSVAIGLAWSPAIFGL